MYTSAAPVGVPENTAIKCIIYKRNQNGYILPPVDDLPDGEARETAGRTADLRQRHSPAVLIFHPQSFFRGRAAGLRLPQGQKVNAVELRLTARGWRSGGSPGRDRGSRDEGPPDIRSAYCISFRCAVLA